jgi:hypothetical protein
MRFDVGDNSEGCQMNSVLFNMDPGLHGAYVELRLSTQLFIVQNSGRPTSRTVRTLQSKTVFK